MARAKNYDNWRKKKGFAGLSDSEIDAKVAELKGTKKQEQGTDPLKLAIEAKVKAYREKLEADIERQVEIYRFNLTKQLAEQLEKIL